MSKRAMASIHRPGARVVKAAESRPAVVSGKSGPKLVPSSADRSLARAVRSAVRPDTA
jgi:hypothetical protein